MVLLLAGSGTEPFAREDFAGQREVGLGAA